MLVIVPVLCGAVASCSVLVDVSDYSGGPMRDTGSSLVDGNADVADAAKDSDRESSADSVIDTSDTGVKPDDADTATGDDADSDVLVDSGADALDAGDTLPDVVADAPEAGACGSVCMFGISEIMPRAVAGSGDKHEWVELTNYGSSALDVSGVTVKVFSSTTGEKASFTFLAGTPPLAAGEAVVIADDDVALKADVTGGYVLGKVFSFLKPTGDVFINSSPFDVKVYASGVSAPYETGTFSHSWVAGRSYSYPAPAALCPASARFTATGTPTAPWKETPADAASKYGEQPVGTALYGTPTKANTVVCP